MLQIIGEVVEEPILEAIKSSKAIGLEIDESIDISVTKQLDVHVRYSSGHLLHFLNGSMMASSCV